MDLCGDGGYSYIIRSDAGVFMKSDNLNKGSNIEVYNLHYSCRGGDHYLAVNGYFYIVLGTSYRRVTDMSTDADAVVYTLHKNCQGGDHYFCMNGKYYIVFQRRGVYRRTTNMNKDEDAVEYSLHSSCRDGLYYWGDGGYAYFIKPVGQWGHSYHFNFLPQYHQTSNLNKNEDKKDFSFGMDAVIFLPGGMAIIPGPVYGEWKLLQGFKNTSGVDANWSKEVSHQKGAKKEKLSSIEHNWNIKVSASYSSGDIAALFAKFQFSLEESYCGKSVDTTTESWEDVTTVTEKISVKVKPCQEVSVWQYKLGFGGEDIVFCPRMEMTNSKKPPTSIPLKSFSRDYNLSDY